MAENKTPLIEKIYYENCPGCKLEQINESSGRPPFKEFLLIWFAILSGALPISSLFPFLYFMIRDFHIAKIEQDIGFYAGYVGSAYMIGRALSSVLWGVISDRYGRKPVILFGTVSVVVFNTLFGLSTSFWMAVSMRFLLGLTNGQLGPIKAYASEVCRPEYQALSLSLVSTAWGMGLIIGPAIGGYFAQPAEKFPRIFSQNSLFGRFPYFLPCLCISLIALVVSISCFWIPETLHNHRDNVKVRHNSFDSLEASLHGCDLKSSLDETEVKKWDSNRSLLTNWPLISSIIVYCAFSLHDMAYTEIFSLWAVSNRKYGGLSFSTQQVGNVLAITVTFLPAMVYHGYTCMVQNFEGFSLLLFQTFLYPAVEKILGPITLIRIGGILTVPLLSSYPLIAMVSGFTLILLINCASVLKNILSVTIVTGLFLLQNNSVPQHQRGAANGISMTAMSLFKAIGPAGGGAVFAWAQKRQVASFLPGDQMVFFMLNLVELIGVLLTFKPFLTTPDD